MRIDPAGQHAILVDFQGFDFESLGGIVIAAIKCRLGQFRLNGRRVAEALRARFQGGQRFVALARGEERLCEANRRGWVSLGCCGESVAGFRIATLQKQRPRRRHVAIVGPVGVGKTFLAHALGHIACRRGASVLAVRTDAMLKTLKHARLDHTYDAELRKLIVVDLLILDDFAIDVLDPTESRDLYDLLLERYRTGSIVVTSNRGPDEWLATFADPLRAQSAIDRFTSNAYDLVIDGESYRPRLKPKLPTDAKARGR